MKTVIAILVFVAASQAYDNNRYNQYNAGYAQHSQQLKSAFPAFNFNSAQLSQQLKPDPSLQLKSAFPAFDFNSAEGKGPDSFLNVALSEAFNLNDLIKTVGFNFQVGKDFLLQSPLTVKTCQLFIENIDCRQTCNYCNLCPDPANQLACESTSKLCKNEYWQNPQQCANTCEKGQQLCKKFVQSAGGDYSYGADYSDYAYAGVNNLF